MDERHPGRRQEGDVEESDDELGCNRAHDDARRHFAPGAAICPSCGRHADPYRHERMHDPEVREEVLARLEGEHARDREPLLGKQRVCKCRHRTRAGHDHHPDSDRVEDSPAGLSHRSKATANPERSQCEKGEQEKRVDQVHRNRDRPRHGRVVRDPLVEHDHGPDQRLDDDRHCRENGPEPGRVARR